MMTQKAAIEAASFWFKVGAFGFALGLVYVIAAAFVGPVAALVAVGLAGLLPPRVLVLPGVPAGALFAWLALVFCWR